MEEKSFVLACKEFFGLKPGQTAGQFLQETKALSNEDRKEIAEGIVKVNPLWKIKDVEKKEAVAA